MAKQGAITKEEIYEERTKALKLSKKVKREERYIRISRTHTIGIPIHLSDEEVQERVERFRSRIGINKAMVV